jgi:hypothetical protein
MSESTDTSTSQTSSSPTSVLAHPMKTVTTTIDHMPGMDMVKGAVGGVLDMVGVVSPRARRVAAYTGAGLLGAAGVIEWPVAAAGAAVVWLTQPRPKHDGAAGNGHQSAATGTPRAAGTAQRRPRTAKASKADSGKHS